MLPKTVQNLDLAQKNSVIHMSTERSTVLIINGHFFFAIFKAILSQKVQTSHNKVVEKIVFYQRECPVKTSQYTQNSATRFYKPLPCHMHVMARHSPHKDWGFDSLWQ